MKKRIVGGVVALALVVTTVILGLWQLSRHNEKQRLADRVESRLELEPVGLGEMYEESVLGGGVDLLGGEDGVKQAEYRRVVEFGRFICPQEVFIRNRTFDGRPGYWVFTPFALRDREEYRYDLEENEAEGNVLENAQGEQGEQVEQGEQLVFIVNRGWLPLELAKSHIADPCNIVDDITGFIRLPKSGAARECESLAPACTFAHPDIEAIADHFASLADDSLDIGTYFYIQLESAGLLPDGPPVVLRAPTFDTGNHLSYAVQWFIFGTIAAVGYFLIFWRKAVFKRKGRSSTPSGD